MSPGAHTIRSARRTQRKGWPAATGAGRWHCALRYAFAWGIALNTGACSAQGDASLAALERNARFRVSSEVVNSEVGPFAASTGAIGNANVWTYGGFETPIVRDVFQTDRDGTNVLYADPNALTHWEIFTDRLLEGAEVDIWRITNGAMRLVRTDHIAKGGAHVRGWWPLFDTSQMIPAEATGFRWRWPDWFGPDSHYYFCLRSIDAGGRESPCSETAVVTSPRDMKSAGSAGDKTVPFAAKPAVDHAAGHAPQGFTGTATGDGAAQFRWPRSNDPTLVGYRIYRSDYPPEEHSGFYLELEGRAREPEQAIRKGDWVMWHKKLYTSSPRDFSLRVWNTGEGYLRYLPGGIDLASDDSPGRHWELARHDVNSPVEDHGETYLRLTLAAGEKARIGLLNNGGSENEFFHPLRPGPWQASAWMRQEPGGHGKVEFIMNGPVDRLTSRQRPRFFDVGEKWKLQFETIKVNDVVRGDGVGWMGFEFTGPATFCIDNFNIGRGDVEFLSLEPEERKNLRDSGMSALRTHMLFAAGQKGFDFEQYTNTGGAIFDVNRRTTLPQVLAIMKSAKINPWLQMPIYFHPDDWRALVEYLAAPYDPATDRPADKPWAYKRFHQGHPAPWAEEFDRWYIELGNETWNRTFQPWNWPGMTDTATGARYGAGAVYGMFQENMIQTMKASPWWKSSGLDRKVRFVLGGWTVSEDFSFSAARHSPSSDFITQAGYNGGWDWGQGPRPDVLASYFEILNDVSQTAITTAEVFQRAAERLNRERTHKIQLGTYEAGPGYAQAGLEGRAFGKAEAAAQERVMKSLAAGTATLDAFLARAYRGFTLQNYFTFEHGVRWTSHQQWWLGGQAWPAWKLLQLFNHEGTGAMLKVETLNVPTWPLPDMPQGKKASPDVPLTGVYALRRGNRLMVFVVSRKVPSYPLAASSGYTPVDIELPIRRYASARLFDTVGTFNDNNLDEDRVRIESREVHPTLEGGHLRIGTSSGTDSRGLPPGATLLYVFEGTDLP